MLVSKEIETFAILCLKFDLLKRVKSEDCEPWSIMGTLIEDYKIPFRMNTIPYPNTLEPDVCLACQHDFGDTIGGRLRNGCPVCQNFGSYKLQTVGYFTQYTGLHPAIAELVIARVIRKYL